ncbi:hypothetical protein [Falsirhodobacter sp. 20TX0035]|uniref:hypothetical protein n=1 Tax=Falsirhodobacter sp. 20TX0035 TaxID=3022019 RepID=UPI00232B26A0|nr:hypothetical protein [Falsirhodobacter sp. 20TX0035]MDB6454699.1 hypothetical protein [Falsirhodobacter sp. 20TX0035]
MASLLAQFAELLAKLEPRVREAFEAAIADLRNGVQIRLLVERLERQDLDGAIEALNLDPAAYASFRMVLNETFTAAGMLQSSNIPQPPGQRVVFRFDVADPAAQRVIRQVTADRVTNIIETDRQAARSAILSGFQQGRHPNRIALDLAGRVGKGQNQRTGGIIGLSGPQEGYVASMRARLLSGDPAEMAKVLEMTRRDKRFDRAISKAIRDGKKLSQDDVAKITGRYSDRLLSLRAETIARTETGMAVMAARQESFRQGLGKTGYPEQAVIRKWRHGGGGLEPRLLHIQMNGKTVQGLTEPFILPDGTRMMHPLDPAGGARHCARCTCDLELNVDYSWGLT